MGLSIGIKLAKIKAFLATGQDCINVLENQLYSLTNMPIPGQQLMNTLLGLVHLYINYRTCPLDMSTFALVLGHVHFYVC